MQRVIKILQKLGIPFHQMDGYSDRVIIDSGMEEPNCIYFGPYTGEYFCFMQKDEDYDPACEADDPVLEDWIREYAKGHENFDRFLEEDACRRRIQNFSRRMECLAWEYSDFIKRRDFALQYPDPDERAEAYKKELKDFTNLCRHDANVWQERIDSIERAADMIGDALAQVIAEDPDDDIPF